jgi:hypothetical protein
VNCSLSIAPPLQRLVDLNHKHAADLSAVARLVRRSLGESGRANEKQAAAVRDSIQKTRWTSDQDIKILTQHFKGVRTPKVQTIANALMVLGQAVQ